MFTSCLQLGQNQRFRNPPCFHQKALLMGTISLKLDFDPSVMHLVAHGMLMNLFTVCT